MMLQLGNNVQTLGYQLIKSFLWGAAVVCTKVLQWIYYIYRYIFIKKKETIGHIKIIDLFPSC